jgi:effector-binding domain-containing protein
LPVPVEVRLTTVDPMPTAVVAATTTWTEFPSLWGPMLDKAWAFLRRDPQGLRKDGHNVMLYKDDRPDVEVGVQVSGPFVPAGDVKPSHLPGGLVATATHLGPIGKIGETHDAVVAWCASNGHRLSRVRWEVYGDPDASGHYSVDVYWSVLASG